MKNRDQLEEMTFQVGKVKKNDLRQDTAESRQGTLDFSTKYVKVKFTVYSSGHTERVMIQFIDVSNSVYFSQSKEQNMLLQTLNASVSHELRNPLNSIVGEL